MPPVLTAARPGMDAPIAPHRRMLTFLILETFPKLPERIGGLDSAPRAVLGGVWSLGRGGREGVGVEFTTITQKQGRNRNLGTYATDTPPRAPVVARGLHKSSLESWEQLPARKPPRKSYDLVMTHRHRLEKEITHLVVELYLE